MVLHGASASPFVRKVLVALAIKNLPYEQIQQMPFTKDLEYRKINPLGKIPTLQDGDLTVCDSSVICEYLEDTYPQAAIYPHNSADKARARWYEELGGTPTVLQGYGVRLDIRNVEYRVFDDRDDRSSAETTALLNVSSVETLSSSFVAGVNVTALGLEEDGSLEEALNLQQQL